MSTLFVKKDSEAAYYAIVRAFNQLHKATVASGSVHQDISGVPSGDYLFPSSSNLQVTAPDATNLASSLVLVNALRGAMMSHFADDAAHMFADKYGSAGVSIVNGLSNTVTGASDLPSAYGTLLFLQGAYNSHITGTVSHQKADSRALSGSLAATQGAVNFVANDMKVKVNGHILTGPTGLQPGRLKLLP